MVTATVELPELPGVKFTLAEGKTLDDAREAALLAGLATAEELFPRPDILGAEREAVGQVARDLPILDTLLAGSRGRLGSIFAPVTGQGEFEARERGPLSALFRERDAARVGAAVTDVGLTGRFGTRLGIAAEGGLGALAAPPGETVSGAVAGAGGAAVGAGVGAGVGLGVRAAREGVQRTLDFLRRSAGPDPRIPRAGTTPAVEVEPVESARDLLERNRSGEARIIEAEELSAVGDVNLAPERERLIGRGDDLGFEFSAGQRTGSIPQQQADAGFASNPLTARRFAEASENNNRTYARSLLRAMGEPVGDAVTPAALGRARDRQGAEFQDIAGELGPDAVAGQKIKFQGDLQSAIAGELSDPRIRATSPAGIPPHLRGRVVSPTLQGMIDDLDSGQPISGAQLMAWRSALTDDVARFSEQGSGALGSATVTANAGIDAIDDAIVRSAGDDLAERYIEVRSQFRITQSAENILRDPLGEVSAKRMNTELIRKFPFEYRRGALTGANPGQRSEQLQNVADFFDSTRIGAGILPEVVANSGTPTRMFIQSVVNRVGDEGMLLGAATLGRQAVVGDIVGQAAFQRGAAFGAPSAVLDVLPTLGRVLLGSEASTGEVLRANRQSIIDQFFAPDENVR